MSGKKIKKNNQLYSSIHGHSLPYLSSCHTMEEVLLWSYACEEATIDESPCPGTGVIWLKGGQGTTTNHDGRTATLQLYLTQQAGDLHTVHLGKKRVLERCSIVVCNAENRIQHIVGFIVSLDVRFYRVQLSIGVRFYCVHRCQFLPI